MPARRAQNAQAFAHALAPNEVVGSAVLSDFRDQHRKLVAHAAIMTIHCRSRRSSKTDGRIGTLDQEMPVR
jgi:hypothetical protein